MAADTAVAGTGTPEETLEALQREVEALKQKLDEERQKLNDVTREFHSICSFILYSSAAHCLL